MTKVYDDIPWIIRVILQIFFGYPIAVVYRIVKGVEKNNILILVVGIVLIFGFGFIAWIVDLVTTILGQGIVILAQ